tara:strand:+ start:670 stop:828 length:159 start_codon:yes stop_codon:yes gene_type:complete
MNTGEFLFMLFTVLTVTSVISVFRYMIHRIASDEYPKKEKKDLTTTIKNVIL